MPSGAIASWTVPTDLPNHASFEFRVRAANSQATSAWSPWLVMATEAPETHSVAQTYVVGSANLPTSVAGGASLSVAVESVGSLPATGIDEIHGAMTVTSSSGASGSVTVAAHPGADPSAALNIVPGQDVGADFDIEVGGDGRVTIHNASTDPVGVRLAVTAWTSLFAPVDGTTDPYAPDGESDPLPDAVETPVSDAGPAPSDADWVAVDSNPNDIPADTDAGMVKQSLVAQAGSNPANSDTDDDVRCGATSSTDESTETTCPTSLPTHPDIEADATSDESDNASPSSSESCDSATSEEGASQCLATGAPDSGDVQTVNSEMDTLAAYDPSSVGEPDSPTESPDAKAPDSVQPDFTTGSVGDITWSSGMPTPANRDHCPASKHYYSRVHACTVSVWYVTALTKDSQGRTVSIDGHMTFWMLQTDKIGSGNHEMTVLTLHIEKADGVYKRGTFVGLNVDSQYGSSYVGQHMDYNSGKQYYHSYWMQYGALSGPNQVNSHQTKISIGTFPDLAGKRYPPVWLNHWGVHKRIDSMTYLGGTGTVMQYTNPEWNLDASEKRSNGAYALSDAARFVSASEDAIPNNPGARYFGGPPLQRTRESSIINANRATACPSKLRRPTGQSCDEYPFAVTMQGASRVPSGYWRRAMVPWRENSLVGTRMNQFFRQYRILDGDRYYVNVMNLPRPCGGRCE